MVNKPRILAWWRRATRLMLLVLLALAGAAHATDAPPKDRGEVLKALVDQNTKLFGKAEQLENQAESDEKNVQARQVIYTERNRLQSQAVELYRQNPADEVAFEAMLFANNADYKQPSDEICRNLKQYHLNNPRLYLMLSVRQHYSNGFISDECEQFYKVAAANAATARVRDVAQLRLALSYQRMAGLLANLSELRMTPEEYFTSESRALHGPLPAQTMDRVRKQFAKSKWLSRDWQPLRQSARELASSVRDSKHLLAYYNFGAEGFEQSAGTMVSEEADRIVYRIDHASQGSAIDDFGAVDLNGDPVSFAKHRGKVLVLELWASWYKPCLEVIPKLRAVKDRMVARPFEIITLSLDRNVGDAKVFMQDNPMPFTNWYIGEDKDFFQTWQVWQLPKRYVIDQHGVIRSIPRLGFEDFTHYLNRLVSEAEAEPGSAANNARYSRLLGERAKTDF